MNTVILIEMITNRIFIFREVKFMLDRDLVSLYSLETK
jgi:hypothetical protein